MTDLTTVIDDLTADAEDVDRLVATLTPDRWRLATPAPGWTVTHQVGHLAFVFRTAGLAAADPDAFTAMTGELDAVGFDHAVTAALDEFVHDPPEVLLSRWRTERDRAVKALAAVPPDSLVPWLVRPVPPAACNEPGFTPQTGALSATRRRTRPGA